MRSLFWVSPALGLSVTIAFLHGKTTHCAASPSSERYSSRRRKGTTSIGKSRTLHSSFSSSGNDPSSSEQQSEDQIGLVDESDNEWLADDDDNLEVERILQAMERSEEVINSDRNKKRKRRKKSKKADRANTAAQKTTSSQTRQIRARRAGEQSRKDLAVSRGSRTEDRIDKIDSIAHTRKTQDHVVGRERRRRQVASSLSGQSVSYSTTSSGTRSASIRSTTKTILRTTRPGTLPEDKSATLKSPSQVSLDHSLSKISSEEISSFLPKSPNTSSKPMTPTKSPPLLSPTRLPSRRFLTETTSTPWIRAFLSRRSKDKLLPIPKDYISDNFNLAQLPPIVERIGYQAMGKDAAPVAKALTAAAAAAAASTPRKTIYSYPIYRRALQLILKEEGDDDDEDDRETRLLEEDLIIPPYAIQIAAEALYLMVHARFIVSPRGLEAIRHVMLVDRTVFGKCPRPLCQGCGMLPYGYAMEYTVTPADSVRTSESLCHRYCPSCGEVWISWNSKTDGCAWGPSWCHLFLLTFGTQVFVDELANIAARIDALRKSRRGNETPKLRTAKSLFTDTRCSDMSTPPPPSVFGFQIHPETPFGRPFNEQSLRVSGGASY